MMTPNHAQAGLLLGLTASRWRPELLPVAAVAAYAGGGFPDFDVQLNHRRTLHYPLGYPLVTAVTVAVAFAASDPVATVGAVAAYFFGAATLHCATDLFVDVEKDGVDTGSDGVVYAHALDEWVGPYPVLSHAGGPGDLAVGLVVAVPPLALYSGVPWVLAAVTLTWSVVYVARREYRRHVTDEE